MFGEHTIHCNDCEIYPFLNTQLVHRYTISLLVARLVERAPDVRWMVERAPEVRRQTTKLLSIRPTLCSFVEIWTKNKNKDKLLKFHLINQANVRDGEKEKNDADK